MRRLTGDEPPEPRSSASQQPPRPGKRRRHGGRGNNKRPQLASPPSAPLPPRADSLAACGLALGASLIPGECNGWSGADAALRCGACGGGQGAHALLDTRRADGRSTRHAYLMLREARALAYCASKATPFETRLATHAARLSRLLRTVSNADGGIAALAEQAAALLPGIATKPAAALRFAALCDSAYSELFIADCLAPKAHFAALPPPHVHLASLLPALRAPSGACSECATPEHDASSGLLCAACAVANPQLAYLRLRDAEAKGPLGLRRLAGACLAAEGAAPGPSGGTQRGCDPVGCDTLRLWQAAVRDRMAAWSAFACPDAAAARALGAFAADGAGGALLEVGAGTGAWAAYLARMCPSLRVTACDSRPTTHGRGRMNEYHASLPPWCAVQPGDAAEAAASAASAAIAAGRPPPALLICYPPPCLSASGAGDMALAALTSFAAAGGTHLALVGEWRGDTGSAALERALSAGWTLHAAPTVLPTYANTCASLTLWRRGAGGVLRWPPDCVACGAAQATAGRPFLRDRLTRAVVACGPACARAPAALAALEAELAARHLPPLRHASAAADVAFAWQDADNALGKLVWRAV